MILIEERKMNLINLLKIFSAKLERKEIEKTKIGKEIEKIKFSQMQQKVFLQGGYQIYSDIML
jgi:Mor family transcriptional regulator